MCTHDSGSESPDTELKRPAMANIAFHNFLFLLIALTESSCAAASVHVASQSACSEESWTSDAGDDVCLLQFLDRGRTAQTSDGTNF